MTRPAVVTEEKLRQRVDELVPVLRERGAETEELRRLPDTTISDFEAADLFGAMRPTEVGGLAIGLGAFIDITRKLARGDASAGWIGGFLMSHSWLLSKFRLDAQEEVFAGRTWVLAAAVSAPPGRAEKVAGGYRLSGRWRFASGILHSEWVVLLAIADDGPVSCIVPVSSTTIHDTWHVPGMKATGSNDVEVVDVFVPEHRVAGFEVAAAADCPGANAYDYPLLRYPMHRVLPMIHPAVALGVADATLDLFRAGIENRTRLQTGGNLSDDPLIHQTYGEAYSRVRSAELMMGNAIDIIDAGYGAGEVLDLERRADLNLSVTAAGVQAFEAVDLMVRAMGASIHRTGHPLDRICRDTQVMRNHGVLDWRYVSSVAGRALLGKGLGDHMDALF
ncbi:acyl-CoA dehydrogenase family protein [Nocardia miyunensis]|uniref:acyl-CoA dehydrogenase family protein n=1 Tax=Nocardia miyunensis TaxID=282684 RepID=UPI000835B4EB|nr:acyl-CoA dehydrogenase family protein [Nocardia miyunensis]